MLGLAIYLPFLLESSKILVLLHTCSSSVVLSYMAVAEACDKSNQAELSQYTDF